MSKPRVFFVLVATIGDNEGNFDPPNMHHVLGITANRILGEKAHQIFSDADDDTTMVSEEFLSGPKGQAFLARYQDRLKTYEKEKAAKKKPDVSSVDPSVKLATLDDILG